VNVVVLVPRRPDGGHRDSLWEFCRPRWEQSFPSWDIVEGEHLDGPFNRSAAVNAAAAAAGDWDVAVIIDSDVVVDPRAVESAVRVAQLTGQMTVSHDTRIMLNKVGTNKVMRGFRGNWWQRTMVDTTFSDSVSCSVVVTRELWDACNGFDERFVGWGYEDTAFRITAEAIAGPILKTGAEVYHLWHPVSEEAGDNSPTRLANRRHLATYQSARWDTETLKELVRDNRPDAPRAPESPAGGIPRILHRTVPAKTSDEIEGFWKRFGELHPGWDLRTYREPIDPADWPISGHLFTKCSSGAQKAGLIRLEALVTHGGIYVDSDVEPYRSFEPLIALPAFAAWEDETTIPDAVLAATAGHPTFTAMLDEAMQAVTAGADAWTSGPGVSTKWLANDPSVLVLPPGALYPYHYLAKAERVNVSAESTPWAFCAHHWHHSWGTDAQRKGIEKRQRA
jgi:hypothetical protein